MSLVIEDEFVEATKAYAVAQCESLSSITVQYIRTMNSVLEQGIMEGQTADAIREFLNQVRSNLQENSATPDALVSIIERTCTAFIAKVDKADKHLYDN